MIFGPTIRELQTTALRKPMPFSSNLPLTLHSSNGSGNQATWETINFSSERSSEHQEPPMQKTHAPG